MSVRTHMSGEVVRAAKVRREVDKEVYDVLAKYEKEGWYLRRQGHKFRFYCPCGGNSVVVNGSPQNAQRHAARVEREIGHCPDRHGLDG